jgi:hypothetical protein
MEVLGKPGRQQSVSFFVMVLMAGLLAFPPTASAVEVGCFCTFVFVSTMFLIGIGITVIVKFILSKKLWQLSFKRTFLITVLEVILLLVVLIVLQTKFYIRVLSYLPLAFWLNYAMTTAAGNALKEPQTPKKRAAMAALSCLVLPAAVQIMALLATGLSNLITFKEVSV